MARTIAAGQLAVGQWIIYTNSRMNARVVEVTTTRDGRVMVKHDFGNGGEPATSIYNPSDMVWVG
jgi:hypothetical protein